MSVGKFSFQLTHYPPLCELMEVKCLHNTASVTHSDKHLFYTLIISTVLQYNVALKHCTIETFLIGKHSFY